MDGCTGHVHGPCSPCPQGPGRNAVLIFYIGCLYVQGSAPGSGFKRVFVQGSWCVQETHRLPLEQVNGVLAQPSVGAAVIAPLVKLTFEWSSQQVLSR